MAILFFAEKRRYGELRLNASERVVSCEVQVACRKGYDNLHAILAPFMSTDKAVRVRPTTTAMSFVVMALRA